MNIFCAHDRMQQKFAFIASCTVTTLPAVRNFNIVVCACSLAKGAWSCKHFTLWTFACHFWICHVPRLHRASLKAGDESVVPEESQDHSIKLVLLRHQPLPLGITFFSTAQGEFSFFFVLYSSQRSTLSFLPCAILDKSSTANPGVTASV